MTLHKGAFSREPLRVQSRQRQDDGDQLITGFACLKFRLVALETLLSQQLFERMEDARLMNLEKQKQQQ